MNHLDDSVRRLLDYVRAKDACTWCQNTEHAVYRTGLCRHCYRIKLEISNRTRYQQKSRGALAAARKGDPKVHDTPTYFLRIAEKMRELAELEGKAFGKVASQATALDVEHALSKLSRRVLKRDLFRGEAAKLGHSFSPEQRKYLLYLLRRILREDSRRTRRSRARYRLIVER